MSGFRDSLGDLHDDHEDHKPTTEVELHGLPEAAPSFADSPVNHAEDAEFEDYDSANASTSTGSSSESAKKYLDSKRQTKIAGIAVLTVLIVTAIAIMTSGSSQPQTPPTNVGPVPVTNGTGDVSPSGATGSVEIGKQEEGSPSGDGTSSSNEEKKEGEKTQAEIEAEAKEQNRNIDRPTGKERQDALTLLASARRAVVSLENSGKLGDDTDRLARMLSNDLGVKVITEGDPEPGTLYIALVRIGGKVILMTTAGKSRYPFIRTVLISKHR